MEQKNHIPAIRFKGFSDEWEEKKFKETVLIERGGSPRPIEAYITEDENGLNWVRIGDAPVEGNYITKTQEKIRPDGLKKTREVHPNDLILSNSMSFGKPYIMKIDGCIHDGWLLIRNEKNMYELSFLCSLLGCDYMLTQYRSLAAGSTVHNLNKDLVGNTLVKYAANIKEQQRIGSFFEKIDTIISGQQAKLGKLKNIKASLLNKMFPAKGEKKPAIRFKGFKDEWEEKKLGEVLEYEQPTKYIVSSTEYNDSYSTPVLTAGQSFILGYTDETDNVKNASVTHAVIIFDDFTTSSHYVDFSFKIKSTAMKLLTLKDGSYDIYFASLILERESYTPLTHGRHWIIIFSKMGVLFPKENEQNKISIFHKKLDKLISLQEQKITKLQNIKKAFLAKMFA